MPISVIDDAEAEEYTHYGLTADMLVQMWRKILLIRRFEERVENLFLVKKILFGPSHLYIGQEAIAVGAIYTLSSDDLIVSHFRGHGHALAKEVPPRLIMAELFGKATGTCRGLGGSMHAPKFPEVNLMYASAIVGSGIPIAAGMALATKLRGESRATVVFFGDGGANTGDFHEGTNMAAIWKLPLVLVCENNQYAISMRADAATAGPGISQRAAAYGIPGVSVDGNDVIAVYISAKEAIERARKGGGPTLLECSTYRIRGHGVYDQAKYRSEQEIERWRQRDPLDRFKRYLEKVGVMKKDDFDSVEREVQHNIDEAVEFGEKSPRLALDDLPKIIYR